ncbi:MAG: thermonuclease family protein [Alphaproteobacteria bacterium]|nr:thermonuclease family protein [Alphaproteobacteria bacterium]
MKYFAVFFMIFALCGALKAEYKTEYKAVDGDSLVRGDERIRLRGIDAPELVQQCRDEYGADYACGQEAFEFLQNLMKGNNVSCKCLKKRDRYKRKLCECFVSNISLNHEMVASGYAISYKSKRYLQAEESARSHKYGLWRGKFMRPAIYRALERESAKLP